MLRLRLAVLPVVCLASITVGQLVAQSTASPAAGAQASPHFPTNEDLRHIKALSAPLLSPDGKQILFTVTHATADGAANHLWIVPAPSAGTDKARQLTFSPAADKRGERDAQWVPDGSAVFFLAKRGDHTQLFRLDLRGGEASPYDLKIVPPVDVSKDKDAINPPPKPEPSDKSEKKGAETKTEPVSIDVAGFAISDDGKYLALWAHDPETAGEKKQKEAKIDASWVNHERHLTRIYLAVLKPDGSVEGEPKTVDVPPDVRHAVWSPVADRLLVFTEAPNEASDLGPAGAAWIVDASAPAKPVKLESVPATVGGGTWSADGNSIVFAAATPDDAPPGYDDLYALVPAAPTAKPFDLTRGFNGQFRGQGLFFSSEGALVAPAAIGTRSTIVRIIAGGKTQPITPIDLGAAVISGLNTNRKQTGWVWLADSGGHPMRLCYAAKLGDSCTVLPTPDLAPASLRTVEPQVVHWKSGTFTVEGLLYLPSDTGSAKVPLILDVHGGPFGAWENRNDPFADFLVGHGWAVLRPNPRGSSNYGVAFAAANKNDLGGGDYKDVMAGLDYVLAHYPIDPARLALMGYSYGGEMAGFVEGKTDRFKAIISGAPVIDQFSEYGTEGGSWYDQWYFGKPWEHISDAWRQSPLAGAAHAKTPFMLIQGESDTTDPLGQAQEMYRALRQEGVPVELVTYPRENHGPLAGGMMGHPSPEPWHGYDARQRIVSFVEGAFSPNPRPSTAPAKSGDK